MRLDRPWLVGVLTLLVGMLASGAAAWWTVRSNAAEASAAFATLADDAARQVADRFSIYQYGLRGARGTVAAALTRVKREDFRRYSASRDVDVEFPGAHGFGLIWRVAAADEARFVADARRDDWPEFSVRQLAAHDGERFIIQYIEPVERNRAAVGLDIASERNRREAALAAARTGAATLTEPITLVQATGQRARSFLLLLPIYRQGSSPQTVADREAAAIGWSYAPLIIDEVLNGLVTDAGLYTLSLRDIKSSDAGPFFSLPNFAAAADKGLERRLSIEIYGRTWEADVRATPAFVRSLDQLSPSRIAIATALVGVLCAALATVLAQLGVRARTQRMEQARRASIVSASDDAIVGVNLEGAVTDWNAGAERLFGYTAAQALGCHVMDLIVPEESAGEEMRIRDTVRRGERLVPFETVRRHRLGELIDVSISAAPIISASGECIGYSKSVRDIRDSRRDRHALNKAQAASVAKSQFLANMSHEIRTPMNAVIGLSYLLERTRLDAEQTDLLGKIKGASQSLLAIINDILDLSKIEASEMRIERAPFMLDALLQELATMCRLQADAKGVALELNLTADLPRAVEGDSTRLRQVLTNLLSNAVKFTERGSVRLNVRRLAGDLAHATLEFEVADSGIGIPADVVPKLFAPFVQADTSTTRRFGGTGLGLSIVRQLVTLMGGTVGVDSTTGVGSRFCVQLSLPVCDADAVDTLVPAPLPPSSPGLAGIRVLVADDSSINLELARGVLEIEGARVSLANNGQEAVDQLLVQPDCADVILMDVQMPVLDGHDATRRIRGGLGLTQLPIIALTAGITTGEYERARAAGMNDVVAKPFDPPELVRVIRKHVRRDQPPAQALAVRANAPIAWPVIDGIDATDACTRLGGDVSLFRSLLSRMIEDFSELDALVAATEPATLAGRLHFLKGNAGTLGAKGLERLAAQAEHACLTGSESLPPLLRELKVEADALRTAAAVVLRTEDPLEAPQGELDKAALSNLVAQLRSFDLQAVKGFWVLAPHLRHLLGADDFALVRQQVETLKFIEASQALESLGR